jgi:hypothetical protein
MISAIKFITDRNNNTGLTDHVILLAPDMAVDMAAIIITI